MRLDGVIFDLDGTLGDTLPICFTAFRTALQRNTGREYTDAEIAALFGPSEEGIFQTLLRDRWQIGLRDYLDAYEVAHAECSEPFLGITEALDMLARRGVKLGVVTAKGPGSAAISLEAMDIARYFDVVEVGGPSGGVKPAAIRRILARWQVSSECAIYVGDAPSDVTAAREAGITPIAAAWAPGTRVEAVRERSPEEMFTTVPEFTAWIQAQTLPRGE